MAATSEGKEAMSSKLGAAWPALAILLSAPGIGAAQQRIFPDVPSFERTEASPRVHGLAARLLSIRQGDSRFGQELEAEVAGAYTDAERLAALERTNAVVSRLAAELRETTRTPASSCARARDRAGELSPVAGLKGFVLAAGFSGHGFMHGPIAGQLMAELLVHGRAVTMDIAALDLARFGRGQAQVEPLTLV